MTCVYNKRVWKTDEWACIGGVRAQCRSDGTWNQTQDRCDDDESPGEPLETPNTSAAENEE